MRLGPSACSTLLPLKRVRRASVAVKHCAKSLFSDGYAREVTVRYAQAFGAKTSKLRAPAKGDNDWWDRIMKTLERPYRLVRLLAVERGAVCVNKADTAS